MISQDQGGGRSRRDGGRIRNAGRLAKFAVKLSWVLEFAEKCGVREHEFTAEQLVQNVLRPSTAEVGGCSFTELISRGIENGTWNDELSQGKPFYFISHAWSRPFSETLDMLVRHFAPEQQRLWRRKGGAVLPLLSPGEVYCWFDVFAINQHADSAEQQRDFEDLAGVVEAAEETLLVLDNGGVALSRAWCLYEAWQTCRTGGDHKLRLLTYGLDLQRLEQAFLDLDFSRAKTTEHRDLDRILASLRNQIAAGRGEAAVADEDIGGGVAAAATTAGFPERTATQELKNAMVRGALLQLPGPQEPWTTELGNALTATAKLCTVYGKLMEAEVLLQRNLEGAENVLGEDDPTTLRAVDGLAVLMATIAAQPQPQAAPSGPPTVQQPAPQRQRRLRYDEAEDLCWRALEGWERVRGAEHPDTLRAAAALSAVLAAQRRLEAAEPQLLRALHGRLRILGADHPDSLGSLAALAALRRTQGRLPEAEELSRQALVGYERVLGPDHSDTLAAAAQLAGLLRAQRRPAEAEPLLRRALEARESTLGPVHPDTLAAASNLAGLLMPLGHHDEAEALFRRALEGLERVVGRVHKDTFAALNNLGSLLATRGRYDEAEPLYRRALEGRELILGADSADTLVSVKNLALLLKLRGKYEEAEALYRRVLQGRDRSQGAGHPEALGAAHSLAGLLAARGKYDEAEVLFRRALAGREQLYGLTHEDTLATASGLAGVLASRGKYDEAEAVYRRALCGREALSGPTHPETLAAVRDLASALSSREKYEEAEQLQRRVLEGREQALGPGRHETLAAAAELAGVLTARGRLEEAEALHRRALGGRAAALGPDHLDTLTSAGALAGVLVSRGKYEEAEHLYRRTLEGRQAVLGDEHVDTLTAMNDLAGLLITRGKYEEAEVLQRRALAGREQLLGESHHDTLVSTGGLAALLVYRGKYDEAEDLYNRTLTGREQTLGVNHAETIACVSSLAGLLASCGRFEKLEALRRRRRLAGGGGGGVDTTAAAAAASSDGSADVRGSNTGTPDQLGIGNVVGSGRPQKTVQRRTGTNDRVMGVHQFMNRPPSSSSPGKAPSVPAAATAPAATAAAAAASFGTPAATGDGSSGTDEPEQRPAAAPTGSPANGRTARFLGFFRSRGGVAASTTMVESDSAIWVSHPGAQKSALMRWASGGLEPSPPPLQRLTLHGQSVAGATASRQLPIQHVDEMLPSPSSQSHSQLPSPIGLARLSIGSLTGRPRATDGAPHSGPSSPSVAAAQSSTRMNRQRTYFNNEQSQQSQQLQMNPRRSSFQHHSQLRLVTEDPPYRRSDPVTTVAWPAARSTASISGTAAIGAAPGSAPTPSSSQLQLQLQASPTVATAAAAGQGMVSPRVVGKPTLCDLLEEQPMARSMSMTSRIGGGSGSSNSGPAAFVGVATKPSPPASLVGVAGASSAAGGTVVGSAVPVSNGSGTAAASPSGAGSRSPGGGGGGGGGAGGKVLWPPRASAVQLPGFTPRAAGRFHALQVA